MKSALLRTSLALLITLAATTSTAESRLPVKQITAGMHVVRAEVAARDQDRQQGLMFREKMGPNEGMLFIFDQSDRVCMWMKNTLLPLSVAFLDDKARIINIEDMAPQTLDTHCSSEPARYALEMNRGWFREKNIKPGTVIGGVPKPAVK
ncbi:DUF192 domain-containing protein [Lacisediminimonas profundi]|uniref:DUF192 domain-containing protein n=1 Tax=Lacisediminimonas profundi TaxID=2603856 RepID=UPI00124B1018|nr:DUF192 domain-containing protein [Lacisediminimonas profundi]